jgi:hypothetical protein
MIPRVVKTVKASEGVWYASWIGEEYVVLDSYEDFYVVCTFNGYGEMIPSLIKICDCRVLHW